ncbi:MAG: insulinase family protein [Opitutaceae bacterium]
MKLGFLSVLSVLLLAPGLRAETPAAVAPQPPATVPAPAVVPPLVRAPNDLSEYRRFTLDNGLKVILVSDPRFNQSAASLAVGAGSLADPKDRQGLAHFTEHMLFLGTEKYPAPGEYSAFLTANGGYDNAYTAEDRTNFHFQIRHEAFAGALERFAQFFIAPLFSPKYAEREMNAVNSEYQRRLENDNWRENNLQNMLVDAAHPAHHFAIGDRETLGGTTHEELLAFYRAHYSADRMTLAVLGKASLDQMEQWVRADFAAIPDRHLGVIHYPPEYLKPKPALRLARMTPVKDLRQLDLSFPLPENLRQFYASKPAELIGFILGSEGPGSLLTELKAEGLATGISAGAYSRAEDFGTFELTVSLTPSGLEHYSRVFDLVFAAINQLKTAGYPGYLFHERQAMGRLDERYADKGEGIDRAVGLANLMQDYPLALAERVPYLWLEENPAAYDQILHQLRPDNLLATLVAKGQPTDKVEHYYGTPYSYSEETGAPYTRLLNPPAVAAIQLPKPNPFIPQTVTQLPLEPLHLIDEPTLSLYYAQDTEFERPMVGELYRFRLARSLASLRTAVLLDFYQACVMEVLNETAYTAGEAGLHFTLAANLEGVTIGIDGYDASLNRLRDVVATNLVDFKLSPERFAALKDRLVRELGSFPVTEAYRIVQQTRTATLREFHFRPDEKLPIAREVSLADVEAFAHQLYAQGKIEALVYGNVTGSAAVTAARRFGSALHPSPVPDSGLLRRRLLVEIPAESVRTSEKLAGNNSCYWREYAIGGDTPELRAATLAFANFINEPYYSEMRTHQQLGYIVWGGADEEEKNNFAYFVIQSGEHPADELEAKSDAFITQLPDLLAATPDATWATIIGGVRAKLEEKDKTIAARAGRFFDLAYNHGADWNRRTETLAALDHLTRQDAAEILRRTLAPATRKMSTFLGFARQHEPKAQPTTTFTDRAAWKRSRLFE